ncbi:MAG: metalloregulator ArsR/SmtB family transcription factor [Oscillospiraceae bacterium]|jgi:ArsR family transcriptional regulator|nr:metalloregulator ArsR/SmtB family transcription factor [Oscillospiraceae bacterium]
MEKLDMALVCRALGDTNRLKIVKMLSGGEKCACRLLEAFEITQPTLSHHMKTLCGCGLVEARKEGRWAHYSLNAEALSQFKEFAASLSAGKGGEGGCR